MVVPRLARKREVEGGRCRDYYVSGGIVDVELQVSVLFLDYYRAPTVDGLHGEPISTVVVYDEEIVGPGPDRHH